MKSKQMNLPVFPLRMQPQLKEAIANRACVENRTQTDLIRGAVKEYLLKPLKQKKQDNLISLSEFNQIQHGNHTFTDPH